MKLTNKQTKKPIKYTEALKVVVNFPHQVFSI